MKKQTTVILALVTITTLLASSAFAWRSVRTGQKNFERAWSTYISRQPDKAEAYFATAADAFGEALAETPPSRTTMFASNLTMAGISLYHAGRYQEAINAMDKAKGKDKNIWEAYLYTALSYANMNDKAKTIEWLTAYIKTNPSQPILSNEVSRQLTNLETDSGTLAVAVTQIDKAAFDQFENNVIFDGRNSSSSTDQCDGTYWWRSNRAPCSVNQFMTN